MRPYRGKDIVNHDAPAAAELLGTACRKGLEDVENAEEDESGDAPDKRQPSGHESERQPGPHAFIDGDQMRVMPVFLLHLRGHPDAREKEKGCSSEPLRIPDARQRQIEEQGDKASRRPRRDFRMAREQGRGQGVDKKGSRLLHGIPVLEGRNALRIASRK